MCIFEYLYVPFASWVSELFFLASLIPLRVWRRNESICKVKRNRPEAKWSNYVQVEEGLKTIWRTEPVSVAGDWDEMWLGVKG